MEVGPLQNLTDATHSSSENLVYWYTPRCQDTVQSGVLVLPRLPTYAMCLCNTFSECPIADF